MVMPRPNLLFIFTDQQRQDTLRCYGNELMKTPSLDGLASESVVFNNAYVTQPVCTPSRSSIMTGLYPHTNECTANNVPLTREHQTIAEMLPENEYHCGYFGKWHLGDEMVGQHGFEADWVATEDGYHEHVTRELFKTRHVSYYYFLKQHGLEPDTVSADGFPSFSRNFCCHLPKELTKPAFTVREASAFIERNKQRPFVAYVNFLEPHTPFHGPFDLMYDPAELEFSPNFLVRDGADKPLRNRLLQQHYGNEPEQYYRDNKARYYGLVSLVDYYVGELLATLQACGLDDNTIVVFTSDHGDMMGDHALMHKTVQYEEAAKVPLLLRVPAWGSTQRFIDEPVSQVDLVPTLLELMDCERPKCLEGYSLVPYLTDTGPLVNENVFIEWQGADGFTQIEDAEWSQDEQERAGLAEARTVITPEGWKLNLRRDDLCELYNLRDDPYELENLYGHQELTGIVSDLTAEIRKWQQRTQDASDI
jgi:arylsulfatase A-like enzyme